MKFNPRMLIIGVIVILFVAGIILMNGSNTPQLPADVDLQASKTTERTSPANNDTLVYWINETDLKLGLSGGKSEWSLHVVKNTEKNRSKEKDIPAPGVTVTAELRNENNKETLTAITDKDGFVKWETPYPKTGTKLYVTEVKGELQWSPTDRAFAQKYSAAAHLSNTEGH